MSDTSPRSESARGRKPWVPSKANLLEIERLAGLGLSNDLVAASLGISRSTFYSKLSEYPELLDTLKRGQAKAIIEVTGSLMQRIKDGNLTAIIFYLKCRAGWKDCGEIPDPAPQVSKKGEMAREILATVRDRMKSLQPS